jgi:hypothetical protein
MTRLESFLLDAQKLFDLLSIESDNRLTIDDSYRRALVTHVKQLFQGRLVGTHILIDEINSFLRKKLLLFITGASAGLAIDNHRFRHSPTSGLELSQM